MKLLCKMEKNRLKVRISNMFRSPYTSCTSKKMNNDVIQNRQRFQLIDLFSPRPLPRPFPSLWKPNKSPQIPQTQQNYKPNTKFPPRCKISERQHLLHPPQNCPPVSPLNSSFACQTKNKSKRKKKTKTRKSSSRSKTCDILDFQGFDYNGLFSSDEESEYEDKTTSFFSSRSLSSVSSESTKRNNPRKTQKPGRICGRYREAKEAEKKGSLTLRGSFAVVKSSRDPYNDFRTSMVEMIVDKKILSADDLENMLHCFLSLNSNHHHKIIVQAFTQIWEALHFEHP